MSTSSTPSNRYIHIEDLLDKVNVEDDNLMIVEDDEDTKKTTVKEFKKALSGDFVDPTRDLFYTSAKIKELQDELLMAISLRAPLNEVNELKTRINNLVLSAEIDGKDPEVVEARGDNGSLSERFNDERKTSDLSYLSTIKKTVTGSEIELDGFKGPVEIFVAPAYLDTTKIVSNAIVVQSKNILNYKTMSHNGDSNEKISIADNGFTYTQTLNLTTEETIEVVFEVASGNAGHYHFKSSVSYDDIFADRNIIFRLHHTDGTTTDIEYSHQSVLEFDASKPFTHIGFVYTMANLIHNTTVTFVNMMLCPYDISEYAEFYRAYYSPNLGDTFIIESDDYIFYCIDSNISMSITYLDNKTTTESILKRIEDLEVSLGTVVDRCGLMEDYGTMQLFNSCEVVSSEETGSIEDGEYEFIRNGINSKKITIEGVGDLEIKQILESTPDEIKTISLCFYIDKPTYDEFRENDDTETYEGIKLILCSDSPSNPNSNYYIYTIRQGEMVQGWNTVCRNIDDFEIVGTPDLYDIKSTTIHIDQNEYLTGKSFYINMIAFNQRLTPTVIFNIEEFQQEGSEYIYPYLTKFNIPATIYINSARSLEAEEYDSIICQRVLYNWDIGGNSCYPNKDLLLENDNYRNQYQALKKTKLYLEDNVIYSPISYSAPYGKVMPITVPILKDLGFKIAKATSTGYIATFTEKDFVIPSQLISNLVTADEIKSRVDYAIINGLAVAFTVRDVTEYGDEVNATKVIFESIVDYINEQVEEGKLQCLSLGEFYNRCMNI